MNHTSPGQSESESGGLGKATKKNKFPFPARNERGEVKEGFVFHQIRHGQHPRIWVLVLGVSLRFPFPPSDL